MAEFQYNNHVHSVMQMVLFLVDHRRLLHMGFEPGKESRVKAVNEFVERMKSALEEVRSALVKAKDDMTQYYNCHREPTPKYEPGDKVYLDVSDIKTMCPSQKL